MSKSSEQELRVLEAKANVAENIAEITYRLRMYVDEGHANKTKIAVEALNASVKAWTELAL